MLGTIHTPLRVLLLDGHHPQALATLRSLGRRRTWVCVASPEPYAPSLLSRYCAESLPSPDPQKDEADFRRWLFATLRRERYDTLLYCSARTAEMLATHANTLRLYSRCALPAPHVLHDLSRPRGREKLLSDLDLGWLTQRAEVPFSPGDRDYALVAIVRRGKPVAAFVHGLRRSRAGDTLPWEAQRASESLEHDEIRRVGLQVLQAVGWDGIATLGFRHAPERGSLTLLGIQPTWGEGLELAIACGIDLPWLYAQLAAGHPITGPTRYRVGLKALRLFTPASTLSPGAHLQGLFAACLPDVRTDLSLRDPLPSLPFLGRLLLWLRRRVRSRWQPAPRKPPKLAVLSGGNRPGPRQISSSMPTRAGGASP